MAAPDYLDLDSLKNTLSLEGVNYADADIQLALTAASRAIDEAVYRKFYLGDDEFEERFYTPRDCRVEIDDLASLVDVSVGFGDTWRSLEENLDFILAPLNASNDGRPWERIEDIRYRFLLGRPRSLRVMGQFGWAVTPPQIVEATSILATKLLRRAREAPFGVIAVGIETSTALRITRTDPDVAGLIDPFIREVVFA